MKRNLCSKKMKNMPGFTLAEILITLGIIGVIAALTIPNLLANQREKATVTALKKSFSAVFLAYNSAVFENGKPDTWTTNADWSGDASVDFLNKLVAYLKITKNCGKGSGCFPNVSYKCLNNDNCINIGADTAAAKIILADGSLVSLHYGTAGIASIYMDVNGFKGPNQFGIDTFGFYTSLTRINPYGAIDTGGLGFDNACKDITKGFISGWGYNGQSCAAWVLFNENMDYLDCGMSLSWNGKTKCD